MTQHPGPWVLEGSTAWDQTGPVASQDLSAKLLPVKLVFNLRAMTLAFPGILLICEFLSSESFFLLFLVGKQKRGSFKMKIC